MNDPGCISANAEISSKDTEVIIFWNILLEKWVEFNRKYCSMFHFYKNMELESFIEQVVYPIKDPIPTNLPKPRPLLIYTTRSHCFLSSSSKYCCLSAHNIRFCYLSDQNACSCSLYACHTHICRWQRMIQKWDCINGLTNNMCIYRTVLHLFNLPSGALNLS